MNLVRRRPTLTLTFVLNDGPVRLRFVTREKLEPPEESAVSVRLSRHEVIAMSEPTSAPDAIEHADAAYWHRRSLDEIVRGTEPLRADESFETPDLTEDEWDRFVRAIRG